MLLIIETLLLILAALGQDHRAAVEGQIFPLDMAPNSVDDQYDGCTRKMADLVETEFLMMTRIEQHSEQVELEAVEKQIRQLLERQAELRAALESSRLLNSAAGPVPLPHECQRSINHGQPWESTEVGECAVEGFVKSPVTENGFKGIPPPLLVTLQQRHPLQMFFKHYAGREIRSVIQTRGQ
ncbi:hypothetical protein QQF64_018343 [Cirrhinus molitorella]|uniref:Uncharacterized protein n=1 Tax=Cirrhinus molitorella TaxID=172907 RepID=A0ABR3LCA7_9TELE